MYNQSVTFIWLTLFWHFVQIFWHFVQISNIWHWFHIYLINVIFGTVSRFVLVLWPLFGYFSICFLRLISFFLHQNWCVFCLTVVYPHPHVLRGVYPHPHVLRGVYPHPHVLRGVRTRTLLRGVRFQTRTLSVWGGFGNSIIVQFLFQNPHPHVWGGLRVQTRTLSIWGGFGFWNCVSYLVFALVHLQIKLLLYSLKFTYLVVPWA